MPVDLNGRVIPVLADTRGDPAHGQATITGAATLRAANVNRRSCTIKNTSTATLYVGASGVGTTDGFPLAQNEGLTLRGTGAIFVNTGGSCDVRFIEEVA